MVEAIHCHPVWICRGEKVSNFYLAPGKTIICFKISAIQNLGCKKKVIGFVQFRDLANGVFKLCVFMLSFKWFIEREHEK